MITKTKITLLLLLIGLIDSAFAAPEARIAFKVKSDDGQALAGIPVKLETYTRTALVRGLAKDLYEGPSQNTDTNGIVVLTVKSTYGIFCYGIGILDGYYLDQGGTFAPTGKENGRWQPWSPTVELVLKPIVNPVPMYARQRAGAHIPKPNQKYGYDLMIGDWVAPVGKGQTVDFYFEMTGYWKAYNDNDSTLLVSFARPEDGIQKFETLPPQRGSVFRSPRQAPADGYLPNLQLRKARKASQKKEDWASNEIENNNYFFRVRTVLDEHGKIRSALYGKIYNGFQFVGAAENSQVIIGDYYLNPESNSRNMEFDTKRNLFKKLEHSIEQVTVP